MSDAHALLGQADASGKQSRGEKKSRKLMSKLGMKPVGGIHRVTVKKAKNVGFLGCLLVLLVLSSVLCQALSSAAALHRIDGRLLLPVIGFFFPLKLMFLADSFRYFQA